MSAVELLNSYQTALALQSAGDYQGAATLLREVVDVQPAWEHGYALYTLGNCLEAIGRIDEARVAFERASRIAGADLIVMTGLPSFLYMHGSPQEAYSSHLSLLELQRERGDTDMMKNTLIAIRELGRRMNLSESEVEAEIQSRTELR